MPPNPLREHNSYYLRSILSCEYSIMYFTILLSFDIQADSSARVHVRVLCVSVCAVSIAAVQLADPRSASS